MLRNGKILEQDILFFCIHGIIKIGSREGANGVKQNIYYSQNLTQCRVYRKPSLAQRFIFGPDLFPRNGYVYLAYRIYDVVVYCSSRFVKPALVLRISN